MKRFFSSLMLAALLGLNLMSLMPAMAQDAPTAPTQPGTTGGQTATPSRVNSIPGCSQIASSAGSNLTAVSASNKITAYLTEGFSAVQVNGVNTNISCSQIIECLREHFNGEYRKLSGSARNNVSVDASVDNELMTKYKPCILAADDGLGLLNTYAAMVYQWIAGIVGSICILVIIASGIQISLGGVSQEEVSAAKDRMIRSLVGLVVLFLSAFILYTINPIFFT